MKSLNFLSQMVLLIFAVLIGFTSFTCSETTEHTGERKGELRKAVQAKIVYYAMPG